VKRRLSDCGRRKCIPRVDGCIDVQTACGAQARQECIDAELKRENENLKLKFYQLSRSSSAGAAGSKKYPLQALYRRILSDKQKEHRSTKRKRESSGSSSSDSDDNEGDEDSDDSATPEADRDSLGWDSGGAESDADATEVHRESLGWDSGGTGSEGSRIESEDPRPKSRPKRSSKRKKTGSSGRR